MVAYTGRALGLQIDTTGGGVYQAVASLRTKSMKLNSETVDVTTADSTGQWRELLANAGVKSMEISFNGIFGDTVNENLVNTLALAGTIRNFRLTHPNVGTYQAPFQITNFEFSGDFNGSLEFTATLASAGEVTFTPA